MNRRIIAFLAAASLVFLLLFWAPWINDDYALNKVVDKLGGPDARFNYLGENMAIKDVPKQIRWFPFGRYVTFPGEAGWIVTFYGHVL